MIASRSSVADHPKISKSGWHIMDGFLVEAMDPPCDHIMGPLSAPWINELPYDHPFLAHIAHGGGIANHEGILVPGDDYLVITRAEKALWKDQERHLFNHEGNPIAKDQATWERFWDWFDGSKVVDDHGRPRVVYHGTRSIEFDKFKVGTQFDEFDQVIITSSGDPNAHLGPHFSQEYDVAKSFADGEVSWDHGRLARGRPGRVMSCYLVVKKPFIGTEEQLTAMIYREGSSSLLDDRIEMALEDEIQSLSPEDISDEEYRSGRIFKIDELKQMHAKCDTTSYDDSPSEYDQICIDLADACKSSLEKHDGVLYSNEVEGGHAWIVFDPHMVKTTSARFNTCETIWS